MQVYISIKTNFINVKISIVIEFISTKNNVLQYLDSLQIENEDFAQGLNELNLVSKYMLAFGVPQEYFEIDLSIARGLDYYTGTVYETFLLEHQELGSVCSGGRYDNLAEYYTNKKLPGVGISIGLTRLFYVLNDLKLLKDDTKKSISKAIVIPMIEDLSYPIEVATKLRQNDIETEIYLEEKAFKKKLNYANKQSIPYAIIIGEDEVAQNKVALKDMQTGEQKIMTIDEVITTLIK